MSPASTCQLSLLTKLWCQENNPENKIHKVIKSRQREVPFFIFLFSVWKNNLKNIHLNEMREKREKTSETSVKSKMKEKERDHGNHGKQRNS